jgi:hypothetical protein
MVTDGTFRSTPEMCNQLLAVAYFTTLSVTIIGWLINVEQFLKWELEGENELLGRNLPQCRSDHLNSHDQTQVRAVEIYRTVSPTSAWGQFQLEGYALLVVAPCSLICGYQCFEGTWYFLLQGLSQQNDDSVRLYRHVGTEDTQTHEMRAAGSSETLTSTNKTAEDQNLKTQAQYIVTCRV